jgi:hypothetical protein
MLAGLGGTFGEAQQGRSGSSPTSKTVWDGVYTKDQAAEGRGVYERACAHCHETSEAPRLYGENFVRTWFEEPLTVPFQRMRETMPQDAPGTLSPTEYLSVLTYVLERTGYPSGDGTLAVAGLKDVIVIGDEGAPVPNFSLVSVVGCLARTGRTWSLGRGSEPVRAKEVADSPAEELEAARAKPLGDFEFMIVGFPGGSDREALVGQKVHAKGFLIREPDRLGLNLTALQRLDENCAR